MLKKLVLPFSVVVALASQAAGQNLVATVRAAIAKKDFALGEATLAQYRLSRGLSSEFLEAQSWLARGALAEEQLDRAETYAVKTEDEALAMLRHRRLDDDTSLPIALGAAIEVQAQVLGERGERSAAVAYLQGELRAYADTSIRTRIQKNINLLSLEGRAAPPLNLSRWLGPSPASLDTQTGKPLLLFFWAHWCPDCKAQAPILARLLDDYGRKGLILIGPTQPYGYTTRGQSADRETELNYIDTVRQKFYGNLTGMAAPVSEENFRNYGASTTPTIVLVDRKGIVRMYHPGQMTYEELSARVAAIAD